jgi:hypothetical protein
MILIDKMKDFQIVNTKIQLPIDEKDIDKGNCVILLNNHSNAIMNIVNSSILEDKNGYKFVYQNRDIKMKIRGKKVLEKRTTERNNFYIWSKDVVKLNGVMILNNLNRRNFYFDTFGEHDVFFRETEKYDEKIKSEEYLEVLNDLMYFGVFNTGYERIMLIDLDDWQKNNRDEINYDSPYGLIYYALKFHLDKFLSLGDINFVVITKDAGFKFNIKNCDKKSYEVLQRSIKTLMKKMEIDEDTITSEINLDEEVEDNEDEEEIDDETYEKIKKQEEAEANGEIPENEEEMKDIANKVLEPVKIKKDAISKRDAELREKQKSLKVNGVGVSDIYLRENEKVDLGYNDVGNKVNTLNKSMTKVRFANFTETYNEKLYQKDVLSIADCLKDKSIPVFIRDAKVEDTSDSLNQKVTYTFYLEDSNRGRHTLKFDMPKFIEGKYMYLNGNKKAFYNQRIAKPLIKTGPDTVQVVTNYNKIFMKRYGEKVEALYEKFKALVMSDTRHFSFKHGDCSRLNTEYKTTIEYDTLAKHFAEIVVKPNEKGKPNLHLIFSQPKLKDKCINEFGMEKEWKAIQESDNQLLVGYYDTGKKPQLYVINVDVIDVTKMETPTLEAIGDPFNYFNLEEVEAV